MTEHKEMAGDNRYNRSKLTMDDAIRIRSLKERYSYKQIAESYNVHVNAIKQIIKNKTYKENNTN